MYYLTYSVKDKAGNEKTQIRQIEVVTSQTYGEIANGDFEDGMNGWGKWFGEGGAGSVEVVDGVAKYTVTGLGGDFYTSQFTQERIGLEQGYTYTVTFKARADEARKMQVKLENSTNYHAYSDNIFDITTEEQTFTFDAKINTETITTGKLGFFLGLIDGSIDDSALTTVYIDDVTMERKILPADLINGDFSHGLHGWTSWFGEGGAGTVEVVDGELKYTVTAIGEKFWTSQFQQLDLKLEDGETYTLTFKARTEEARKMQVKIETGEAFLDEIVDLTTEMQTFTFDFTMPKDAEGVKLGFFLGLIDGVKDDSALTTVYIDDVHLVEYGTPIYTGELLNGDFSEGMDGWDQWAGEGGAATVEVVDGEAKYTVTAIGGEFWTSQFQQLDLKLEKGKTYVLTFKARAEDARKMQVKLEKNGSDDAFIDEVIDLTTEMQTFTFEGEVTIDTTTSGKLAFFLGLINESVDDSALTTVYIDDVTLTVK